MQSIPGIQVGDPAKIVTEILCPAGCGAIVRRISANQGVYVAAVRSGMGVTTCEEGACESCGSTYRIPVTTAPGPM